MLYCILFYSSLVGGGTNIGLYWFPPPSPSLVWQNIPSKGAKQLNKLCFWLFSTIFIKTTQTLIHKSLMNHFKLIKIIHRVMDGTNIGPYSSPPHPQPLCGKNSLLRGRISWNMCFRWFSMICIKDITV